MPDMININSLKYHNTIQSEKSGGGVGGNTNLIGSEPIKCLETLEIIKCHQSGTNL